MNEVMAKVVGICLIVEAQLIAAFGGIIFLFAAAFGSDAAGSSSWDPSGYYILLASILASIIIIEFLWVLAGIGLIAHKKFGRILAIILSIIQLIIFPIGTAFGVFYLIVLFNKDIKELFV